MLLEDNISVDSGLIDPALYGFHCITSGSIFPLNYVIEVLSASIK